MPAISVIMPVYDREHTVGRAVASVLAQDFADWELIVVDDASSDESGRVVEKLGDARIVLLRQAENRGGGAARNRGIHAARAEIVSFLDSDDVFLPRKLGFVTEYFARHPEIDVLLDSFEVVYPPERHKRPVARINPPLSDSQAIAAGIYARRFSKATPALSARRAALLKVGLFDESLKRRQDFDLVMRLTGACRCATTDRVLWTKHWAEATITAQSDTFMAALLETCRRHPEYLSSPEHRVGVAKDLARHAARLAAKRRLGLLRADLDAFARAHGVGATLQLLALGAVENLKRAISGAR